jgi:hypothetical protein
MAWGRAALPVAACLLERVLTAAPPTRPPPAPALPPTLAAVVQASDATVPNPVPPLPPGACMCRLDSNGTRIPRDCPSAFDHPAGTSRVPPALTVGATGALLLASTGAPAALRGANWFGWENGQHNPDGLWAFCDDNSTSSKCAQDGEVPPWDFPSPAIGGAGQNAMQIYFWQRRMTNDFAAVVWRLRLLGFNAVRLPFTFAALADDLGPYSKFYHCVVRGNGGMGDLRRMGSDVLTSGCARLLSPACGVHRPTPSPRAPPAPHPATPTPQNDPDDYIAKAKTLDPSFPAARDSLSLPDAYAYKGVAHPPPAVAGAPAGCGLPWTAPFLDSYTSPSARAEFGSELKLTTCNWWAARGLGRGAGDAACLPSRCVACAAGRRALPEPAPCFCRFEPAPRTRPHSSCPLPARYLPQGTGVLGVHRLLWQVEYLVSQGFYVLLDFHPSSDATDPNVADPALLAKNWGALWVALAARDSYATSLKGRVVADLINEARWGGGVFGGRKGEGK